MSAYKSTGKGILKGYKCPCLQRHRNHLASQEYANFSKQNEDFLDVFDRLGIEISTMFPENVKIEPSKEPVKLTRKMSRVQFQDKTLNEDQRLYLEKLVGNITDFHSTWYKKAQENYMNLSTQEFNSQIENDSALHSNAESIYSQNRSNWKGYNAASLLFFVMDKGLGDFAETIPELNDWTSKHFEICKLEFHLERLWNKNQKEKEEQKKKEEKEKKEKEKKEKEKKEKEKSNNMAVSTTPKSKSNTPEETHGDNLDAAFIVSEKSSTIPKKDVYVEIPLTPPPKRSPKETKQVKNREKRRKRDYSEHSDTTTPSEPTTVWPFRYVSRWQSDKKFLLKLSILPISLFLIFLGTLIYFFTGSTNGNNDTYFAGNSNDSSHHPAIPTGSNLVI